MKATVLFILTGAMALAYLPAQSQAYRWQQKVSFEMDVTLDVVHHKLTGSQSAVYSNHSPDTLSTLYYHLYFNAFQPGSMMDIRSRTISDPDPRIADRISKLGPTEIGYQKILSIRQNNQDLSYEVLGTVMTVHLKEPVLPNHQTKIDLDFEAQVPVQIRRSGRNNKEGVAYTMTQWYPKIAEYDYQGWHTNPYIEREFFGVLGDFNVTIHIDSKFVLGGTGVLQNADEVGHGYSTFVAAPDKRILTWRFKAENVHDFAWAADPEFTHDTILIPEGPEVHFFYKKNPKTSHWKQLPEVAAAVFTFMNKQFGKYPYSTYSVIQAGDGGMEYPMCTMIMGEGSLSGTSSAMIHEVAHSWFHGALATNETLYAWMDEGFTTYATQEIRHAIYGVPLSFEGSYQSYRRLVLNKAEEPASLYADYHSTNEAYKMGAYVKGCLFLAQLRMIMGPDTFYKAMRAYFDQWKFRHPEPGDFISVMERTSGMQLKWFMNYWIYTTKTIDYSVKEIKTDSETIITLERNGPIPMPLDVMVVYKDGSQQRFHIPMSETLTSRPLSANETKLEWWWWTSPVYLFKLPRRDVERVTLDPDRQIADINRDNNVLNSKMQ